MTNDSLNAEIGARLLLGHDPFLVDKPDLGMFFEATFCGFFDLLESNYVHVFTLASCAVTTGYPRNHQSATR